MGKPILIEICTKVICRKLVRMKSLHEVIKCHDLMIVGSLLKVVRYIFIVRLGQFV